MPKVQKSKWMVSFLNVLKKLYKNGRISKYRYMSWKREVKKQVKKELNGKEEIRKCYTCTYWSNNSNNKIHDDYICLIHVHTARAGDSCDDWEKL